MNTKSEWIPEVDDKRAGGCRHIFGPWPGKCHSSRKVGTPLKILNFVDQQIHWEREKRWISMNSQSAYWGIILFLLQSDVNGKYTTNVSQCLTSAVVLVTPVRTVYEAITPLAVQHAGLTIRTESTIHTEQRTMSGWNKMRSLLTFTCMWRH